MWYNDCCDEVGLGKMRAAGKIKFFVLVIFVCVISVSAYAESFRTHALFPVTISEEQSSEQVVTVGINDSIAIFLPEKMTYCEGLEIQMQIPRAVAEWRDSVVFCIYGNIYPHPNAETIDFTGTRLHLSVLPMRSTWNVQIPLKHDNTIKADAFAEQLNIVPDISSGFLFVRFQPAMKGIPNETLEAHIRCTIRPILINKGALFLDVSAPGDKPYIVLVDDKQVPSGHFSVENSGNLIDVGNHTISIVSEHYRNETRTIRVEQAKTVSLSVTLKDIAPTLFVAPSAGVEIFWDDEPFNATGREVVINEGEHRIKFKTSAYELTKQIYAQNGKSYTASLSLDIQVTEE